MTTPSYEYGGDERTRYGTEFQLSPLIKAYAEAQSAIVSQIGHLASNMSTADPGDFLLAQFGMSQINQIGQSSSNII